VPRARRQYPPVGGPVRTTAQPVEAQAAVQDEIVERVVGAIEPEMLKCETLRSRGKTLQSLTARDLIQTRIMIGNGGVF
jgi:hypothetical protein